MRPPDAPRPRDRALVGVVFASVLLGLGLGIAVAALTLLVNDGGREPRPVGRSEVVVAVTVPAAAWPSVVTMRLEATATPEPTATPRPTSVPLAFCGLNAKAGDLCTWPAPPAPTPTPYPDCGTPDPFSTCVWRDVK